MSRKRAGLVVIGDEVLSARIPEGNIGVVLKAFADVGVITGEVAVLADDRARIAAVVRDFRRRFDVVVTTGGVGPTHDDMTWAAVADAHDVPLVLREDLLAMMEARNGGPLTAEQKRMLMLPADATLERVGRGYVIRLGDVWVLPGVPSMVAARIGFIAGRYGSTPAWLATVRFAIDEWDVISAIDGIVTEHPDVEVGSYPIFDQPDHKLKLTFVADRRELVAAAVEASIARVGAEHLVDTTWSGGTT